LFSPKNRTLQTASVVIIPWFLLFSLGGAPGELRDMFDILPLILLLTIQSIVQLIIGTSEERSVESDENARSFSEPVAVQAAPETTYLVR